MFVWKGNLFLALFSSLCRAIFWASNPVHLWKVVYVNEMHLSATRIFNGLLALHQINMCEQHLNPFSVVFGSTLDWMAFMQCMLNLMPEKFWNRNDGMMMVMMIMMRMMMMMITPDFGLLNRHRPQPAISARQSVIILTISGRSNSIGFSARLTSFRHFASSGSCWRSSEIWEHSLHADMVS